MNRHDMKDEAFKLIKSKSQMWGVPKTTIQRRFGITDPSLEHARDDVWKLSSALAQLVHDGFVTSGLVDGQLHYFAVSE